MVGGVFLPEFAVLLGAGPAGERTERHEFQPVSQAVRLQTVRIGNIGIGGQKLLFCPLTVVIQNPYHPPHAPTFRECRRNIPRWAAHSI